MTDLTGKLIANTYKDLLTVNTSTTNTGLDNNLRKVQDGAGNSSSLKLSQTDAAFTGNVSVNGNLTVEGTFQPDTVNTNELQATRISATSITTNFLTAGTLIFQDVSVSSLRTGNLYAANISAGTVSATNINATNITVAGDNVATSSALASVNDALVSVEAVISSNIVFVLNAQASVLTILAGLSATDVNLQNNINSVSTTVSAVNVQVGINATQINTLSTSITANASAIVVNSDAITSINSVIAGGAFASVGTSATLETRIAGVSSTMATSINNSNTAITNLSATLASTSATLESHINTVSATLSSTNVALQTSIGNSNTAIATLSATMATSIGNKVSKSGDTMTGDLSFGDNNKINLGAGSDLNLYHDGSDSIIEDTGTGDLIIKASQRIWMKGINDETLIRSTEDSEISLYHNNNEKLSTLPGGIIVYGNIKGATLTISDIDYPAADGTANQVIKTDGAGTLSFTSVITDGSVFASAGTSATLETRIATVSSTMAASIASVSATMATSIANSNSNIAAVSVLTKTNLDAIASVNSIAVAAASAGTSASLETRIATVSSTLATSIANSNAAIAAVSSTMATSINNSNTAITSVNTRINSVSVLAETKASAATSANLQTRINAVSVLTQTNKTSIAANASAIAVLQGATYASAGTSATLESRIAGVSSTMATSISNSNSAIATLSATMATSIANHLRLSGGTLTGSLTLNADPSTNLQAATKAYVDNLTASSIHVHEAVRVETNTTNLNATYDNGSSGVGATLTNAGTQEALVIDGVTLNTSDRVLVIGQTNQTQNGVYVVTNTGSPSTNWILTRSDDADTSGDGSPDTLDEGSYFFVQEGTIGAAHSFVCNTQGTIVFGTTNITFAQFSDSVEYTAGTGINVNASRVISTSGVATTGQLTTLSATLATSIANVSATLESRIATVSALIPTSLTELGISDGTAGQYLQTNANGTYSFTSVAGGGSGISNITAGTNIALTQNGVTVTDTTTSATINVVGVASAGTSAALESRIASVSSAMATSINNSNAAITALSATMATSINNSNTNIAAVSVLTKTNKDAITSINGVLGDGSTFASAGTSATLQTKIATLSATMATSINNSNTAIATLSATMATSINNSNTNITTNAAAITSINGVLGTGAFASAGTSATLQTKIATLSATMATSINNRTAAITSVNTRINAVSVLTKTNKDDITSINGVLGDGSAFASAGTSATLQTKINTVSSTMATSINNSNSAIATLSATMATSISNYLPLAGGTVTGDVSFGDDDKAIFGAGSDLQIYHDGSNSYVKDAGTGDLYIQGTQLRLQSATGESFFVGVADGSAYVYHNGSAKLETTSTGIEVTGNVVSEVAINTQTGTTYTTVLADQSKLVTLNNGSAITLTIPANSSVAYPVGTKIDFAQLGAGQVTFAGAGGVTVNGTPTLKLRAQYSAATCIKIATDTWLLVGDLAES